MSTHTLNPFKILQQSLRLQKQIYLPILGLSICCGSILYLFRLLLGTSFLALFDFNFGLGFTTFYSGIIFLLLTIGIALINFVFFATAIFYAHHKITQFEINLVKSLKNTLAVLPKFIVFLLSWYVGTMLVIMLAAASLVPSISGNLGRGFLLYLLFAAMIAVASIYLIPRLFFALNAIVIEKYGIDAMQRSWDLTKGHWWLILASIGLSSLISIFGLTITAKFLASIGIDSILFHSIFMIAITPFIVTCDALFYSRLLAINDRKRERKNLPVEIS